MMKVVNSSLVRSAIALALLLLSTSLFNPASATLIRTSLSSGYVVVDGVNNLQ